MESERKHKIKHYLTENPRLDQRSPPTSWKKRFSNRGSVQAEHWVVLRGESTLSGSPGWEEEEKLVKKKVITRGCIIDLIAKRENETLRVEHLFELFWGWATMCTRREQARQKSQKATGG